MFLEKDHTSPSDPLQPLWQKGPRWAGMGMGHLLREALLSGRVSEGEGGAQGCAGCGRRDCLGAVGKQVP